MIYYGYKIEKAIKPPTDDGLYNVMTNRYWKVHDGHLLFYQGFSPQCNKHRSIVSGNDREVLFFDIVYIPMRETNEGAEPSIKRMEKFDL